jgi:hypothetical protein
MDTLSNTENRTSQHNEKMKRIYEKPDIKEVWNEKIGMTGVYLLEM